MSEEHSSDRLYDADRKYVAHTSDGHVVCYGRDIPVLLLHYPDAQPQVLEAPLIIDGADTLARRMMDQFLVKICALAGRDKQVKNSKFEAVVSAKRVTLTCSGPRIGIDVHRNEDGVEKVCMDNGSNDQNSSKNEVNFAGKISVSDQEQLVQCALLAARLSDVMQRPDGVPAASIISNDRVFGRFLQELER